MAARGSLEPHVYGMLANVLTRARFVVVGCAACASTAQPATTPAPVAQRQPSEKQRPADPTSVAKDVATQLRTKGTQLVPDLMQPPLLLRDEQTGDTIVCGVAAHDEMTAVGRLLVDTNRPAVECNARPAGGERSKVVCTQSGPIDGVTLAIDVEAGRLVDITEIAIGASDHVWTRTTSRKCGP